MKQLTKKELLQRLEIIEIIEKVSKENLRKINSYDYNEQYFKGMLSAVNVIKNELTR